MVGVNINSTFDQAIGQNSVKQTLSLYIDAYKTTDRLPFLNLVTGRGGGKSFFVRTFRKGLRRSDGTTPKIFEVNASTISNSAAFFEQVYPTWVESGAMLFLDEVHNLPKSLQQIFLSIFDVKDDPVRTVEFEDGVYNFDFRKISAVMATTDQQKLAEPLRDRLRDICFEEYSYDELYDIFINNLDNVTVDYAVRNSIKETFRGNPRDAVVKALDINTYVAAKNCQHITQSYWDNFCSIMGVHKYGINHSEKLILKALSENNKGMTLGNLACVTGFERSVIQKEYETILIRKGLIELDGKRKMTEKGRKFAKELFVCA
jgi:Holliday junction resolvasome RuvABC ATP-dependent DNA helicase subunit